MIVSCVHVSASLSKAERVSLVDKVSFVILIVMPSHASMHLAAIEDEDWMNERVDFWQDVYGFDMTAMQDFLYLDALVDLVDQKCVVSSTAELIVRLIFIFI